MDHSDGIITDHSEDKKDRGDHDGGIAGGCAALQCAHKESGGKDQTIWCQYSALSRLYLYVHYPTDIIGGVIFGSLSGYLGYKIVEWIQKKKIK